MAEKTTVTQRLYVALLAVGLLSVGLITASLTSSDALQICSPDEVIAVDGTCVPFEDPNAEGDGAGGEGKGDSDEDAFDPNDPNDNPSGLSCPLGYVLTPALECAREEDVAASEDQTGRGDEKCPPGYLFDEAADLCAPEEEILEAEPDVASESLCDDGFSVGADGETCIADSPDCGSGMVLDTDGSCVRSFQCRDGLLLGSDLLSCVSRCPDGQLESVDGSRCLAPEARCPNGSPRPVGGACLTVEVDDVADGEGSGVTVRCADADLFCQALVKQCAEERAAGITTEDNCEDPRGSCATGDDACEAANERLAECAALSDNPDAGDDDADRACRDLCPPLHSLDDAGQCIEYLDPTHPCVSWGRVPAGVTTNAQLEAYSYLAGTGQCVTRVEFLRRLGNFEAAAEAEADALAELRATTTEYLSVEDQLDLLDDRLTATRQSVIDLRDEAAEIDVRRGETAEALEVARTTLAAEQKLLRSEVLEFYVGGGDEAIVGAVLAADSVSEIGLAQSYGRAVIGDQVSTVERVAALETETAALAADLKVLSDDVETRLAEAKTAQLDVESLVADTTRLRAEQLDRRNLEAQLVADLREDKADYAQQLGVFEQASREIADIIDESEFLVTEFAEFDGLLAPPVLPPLAGSGFGPRLHPILGYVRNHDGIDFSASFGQSIYASANGVVQIAQTFGGYGQTVVIDHGAGLLTLYAHMSGINVDQGQEVAVGDVIGFIGSTGLSTGPHLHFEVWTGGSVAVDPAPYLGTAD